MVDLVDAVANGNSLSETAGRINGGGKPARPGTWILMVVHSVVRSSAYFDSVTLMLVQREVRQLPGVEEAGAVMGTDANKELLRDAGLLTSEAQAARPDDLILAVRAGSGEVRPPRSGRLKHCSCSGGRMRRPAPTRPRP